jgi:uncharacterized protein YndB with AHSA1/START domain
MTGFKTSVRIRRPIKEVFVFVSDPLKFPRWNSAVQSVRKTAGRERQVGSTYSMRRALPSGGVHNELEIFAWEEPAEFGIRTTSGPTPFAYRYRFSSRPDGTLVHLGGSLELPGAASLIAPLAARAVKRGVDLNLAALKRTLEAPPSPTRRPEPDRTEPTQPQGSPR